MLLFTVTRRAQTTDNRITMCGCLIYEYLSVILRMCYLMFKKNIMGPYNVIHFMVQSVRSVHPSMEARAFINQVNI